MSEHVEEASDQDGVIESPGGFASERRQRNIIARQPRAPVPLNRRVWPRTFTENPGGHPVPAGFGGKSALGKPFLFVLNQCPPGRSIRTTDAYRALLLMGAVAGVTLALRADHLDSLAQGLGVTERDPNGKAAAEIRDLLLWLLLKLEGGNDEEAARVA